MKKNPWMELPRPDGSYVLDTDRADIARYNLRMRDQRAKVVPESIPEPFIGSPESATVVLLNLNPGHDESDRATHCCERFRGVMLNNLHHSLQDFPFYPLNPAFKGTGVEKWWSAILSKLRQEPGLDDSVIATGLLVIEWFPYHSEISRLPTRPVCKSQEYSFELAKGFLDEEGVEVVRMRKGRHWLEVDPRFGSVPALKSQRPWISRGNMDAGLFDRIVSALKRGRDRRGQRGSGRIDVTQS
jgi:hypothetical protein